MPCINQELRERLLAKSREQDGERLARNTRQLEDLPIGTPVVIQNQTGRYPTKWDKTGVIVEIKPHNQLVIKVDGSRRLTLRNRRFVKKLTISQPSHQPLDRLLSTPPSQPHRHDPPSQPRPPGGSSLPVPRQPELLPPDNILPAPVTEHKVFEEDRIQPEDEVTVDAEEETGDVEEASDVIGMEHGMGTDIGAKSPSPVEVPGQQENEASTTTTDTNRPMRRRKPNVKYSAAEYDLCSVKLRMKIKKQKEA